MQHVISNRSCIVHEDDALRCATAFEHIFAAQQTLKTLPIFLEAIQEKPLHNRFKKTVHNFTSSHPPNHQVSQPHKMNLESGKSMNLLMTIVPFIYVCKIFSH